MGLPGAGRWLLVVVLSSVALVALPASVTAQEDAVRPEEEPAAEPEEGAEETTPADADSAEAQTDSSRDFFIEPNPCDVEPELDHRFLDKTRSVIFQAVCKSGRWFDDFFGEESYWLSARHTWGLFGLRLVHDEVEGTDYDVTFSANLPLPNLEDKVNVFLRREDEERFVSDPDSSIRLVPALLDNEAEREWLLGAAFRPGGGSKGFDFDAGVELLLPLEPYVRARYRHSWLLGDDLLVRARPSVYWRNQHGAGGSLTAEIERSLGEDFLLRSYNFAAADERTYGVDWRSGLTLYQMIGFDRALAYQIAVEGETDDVVPVHRWIGEVTLRQRMFREWFFGELLGGVAFVHETPTSPREPSFYVGIGFELKFAFDE